VTVEAFRSKFEKVIDGFSVIFHQISYQKIGTSTLQSRACAGVAKGTYLFALPGSMGAVKDGWDGILKWQLDSRHHPCNFVEIMPAGGTIDSSQLCPIALAVVSGEEVSITTSRVPNIGKFVSCAGIFRPPVEAPSLAITWSP
jgi:hypothetical protein